MLDEQFMIKRARSAPGASTANDLLQTERILKA